AAGQAPAGEAGQRLRGDRSPAVGRAACRARLVKLPCHASDCAQPYREHRRSTPIPKRIVIFADGNGNTFLTQESNVWRLYDALDKSQPDQIACYIRGVGTSSIKVLSALDAATGFGVPSNVRQLYRFLCRNWEPGDQVFVFGFSRGAFTIR